MTIYKAYMAKLEKRFRLGPAAAMSADRCEALAEVIEERLAAIERQLAEGSGDQRAIGGFVMGPGNPPPNYEKAAEAAKRLLAEMEQQSTRDTAHKEESGE